MLTTITVLLSIYLFISIFFYFTQNLYFFRPEILPSQFQFSYPFDFEENSFEMEDGGLINSILFKVPNSRGVIFYFKGNSRSIKGWSKFSKDFISNGYDFFMMDYRGFGKSRGKKSEATLYSDSQFLYKWLSQRYLEKDIIIYGRSLGSGIAARIASWNNPTMLILDSPYYSFYKNISRWGWWIPLKYLLKYKIRTDHFIKNIKSEIHIIHGTSDRLIPYAHSALLKKDKPSIYLHPIEGAGHNNLPSYSEYHQIIYDLLDKADEGDPSLQNLLVA